MQHVYLVGIEPLHLWSRVILLRQPSGMVEARRILKARSILFEEIHTLYRLLRCRCTEAHRFLGHTGIHNERRNQDLRARARA